jgi:hypothetical protein
VPGVLGLGVDGVVGDEGEPDCVVSLGVLGVADGGGGVVGGTVDGDADGLRSIGRSPTRPVPLSEQAVARAAISARAEMPASALFMDAPPGLFAPNAKVARGVPPTVPAARGHIP